MGRLNKALERIKNDEVAYGRKGNQNPRRIYSPGGPVTDPIGQKLARVTLDPDILYENHIITDDIDPVAHTSYKMLRTLLVR